MKKGLIFVMVLAATSMFGCRSSKASDLSIHYVTPPGVVRVEVLGMVQYQGRWSYWTELCTDTNPSPTVFDCKIPKLAKGSTAVFSTRSYLEDSHAGDAGERWFCSEEAGRFITNGDLSVRVGGRKTQVELVSNHHSGCNAQVTIL
jgi:hypothetical protein